MLDRLDPDADNMPALWQQFLYEFEDQFQDTQKEERAQDKLGNLKMRFPHIDQYIVEFKELARQVGYSILQKTLKQPISLSKGLHSW
jgi:Retrotransposon gag protein